MNIKLSEDRDYFEENKETKLVAGMYITADMDNKDKWVPGGPIYPFGDINYFVFYVDPKDRFCAVRDTGHNNLYTIESNEIFQYKLCDGGIRDHVDYSNDLLSGFMDGDIKHVMRY